MKLHHLCIKSDERAYTNIVLTYGSVLPSISIYTIYISSNMDACVLVFFISLLFALSPLVCSISLMLSPSIFSSLYFSHALTLGDEDMQNE